MSQHSYVGTRWHKCDLHLHTPASKCFRDRDTVTPEQWVQAALDKNLSCVAVTDHNTGEWIDRIKEAAEGTALTVFPGVEITCSNAKVHLLILFDTDKTTEDITDFLLLCGIERNDFGKQNAHSPKPIDIVTAIAHERNAIVIPAHIDEFNGISQVANGPRNKFLERKDIKSVQVVHEHFTLADCEYNKKSKEDWQVELNEYYGKSERDVQNGRGFGLDRIRDCRQTVKKSIIEGKAIMTFSDNPHQPGDPQHGLWGIGRRYTWIKMDDCVSLDCLNQALLVPELRIKNDFEVKELDQPYYCPNLWIERITFAHTMITNHDEVVSVDFSPQMTNIVGGRGSGKSTVLSFLRGMFPKYCEALEDVPSIKREFDDFFKIPSGNSSKGVLGPATEVCLYLRRGNTSFKVEYKKAEGGNSKVYRYATENEEWVEETDEGFIDLLDLEIYSQKQVYEIANRPNALRNKIDRDIPEVADIKHTLSELHASFLTQCAAIRNLEIRIGEKVRLQTEINDLERRLATNDVEELRGLLQQRQQFSEQQAEFDRFEKALKNQADEIDTTLQMFDFPDEIPSVAKSYSTYEGVKSATETLHNDFVKIKEDLARLHERYMKIMDDYKSAVKKSRWEEDNRSAEENYIVKEEELRSQGIAGITSATDIDDDLHTIQEKKRHLLEIVELEKELEKAREDKDHLRDEWFEKRGKLTRVRYKFLEGLLGGGVKAKVNSCGDIKSWESGFRSIINAHGSHNDDISALKQRWSRGRNPKDNNESYLVIFRTLHQGERLPDFTGHLTKKMRGLSPEQMDRLELLLPEDQIEMQYKANEKSPFRPIATASPGQKTAAILTFLLLHGEKPLIIDQPEDDLDTSLIHSLVVKQLRAGKDNRQVIIVTHNPNIPVNGDSEQIIVMDADSEFVTTKHRGSIDNKKIRELICEVMEGGVEAFNLRSQRYKLD